MHQDAYLKRFQEIAQEKFELTKAKNTDYAGKEDAFKNFKLVESLGICSTEVGVLVRMCDKIARAATLIHSGKGEVKSESLKDTIRDLSIYSDILEIILEARENGTL